MDNATHESFSDDVFISTGEAAKMLRVSPKTVARWAKNGRLPHILTLGGHRRFPRSAVAEVARQTTVFKSLT